MMSGSTGWINYSNKLKRGIFLINKIDPKKFHLLLNRIILEMKQYPNSIPKFTKEEEEKLERNLSLCLDDLLLVINSCTAIICQAIYKITNPEKFKKILTEELKFNEEQALSFFNVWSSNAKSLILKVKQKSVYCTQLEDVSWLMNIEISSQENPQTFVPKSILQLKLKEGDGTSNMDLELDEKELYLLYNMLENIQEALDCMS